MTDDVEKAMSRIAALEEGLRLVVDALDDAIKHNVNATEHDPAGWTQEDYDAWEEARSKGLIVLRGYPEVFALWECKRCGGTVSNDEQDISRCPDCHTPRP